MLTNINCVSRILYIILLNYIIFFKYFFTVLLYLFFSHCDTNKNLVEKRSMTCILEVQFAYGFIEKSELQL
jgi:hypothetical protein